MKLFVVAVPLFDANMAVKAYELRYQPSEKLFGLAQSYETYDSATYSPGIDLLNLVGLEPFTGGKPIFIALNKFLLLSESYKSCQINPAQVVFILSTDIMPDPEYLNKCIELKNAGYGIALNNLPCRGFNCAFYNIADYAMINTGHPDYVKELKVIQNSYPRMKLALTNIFSKKSFNSLKVVSNALYEGRFYNQPVTVGVTKVSPLKANSLRLLRIVSEEDFDLDQISDVVAQDTALSISLLKFINSPAVGLTSTITSINHAVAMLGQIETSKWIKAAVSAYLADDKPNEISKLSLSRAKFAENLAIPFNLHEDQSSLFLMGLFSLLDIILDMPMENALQEVPVSPEIRDALISRSGKYADIINLIFCYEAADWEKVSYILLINGFESEVLNQCFISSLIWYRDLLEGIGLA